ncbi:MAG TPA: acyltransferase family protein [Flavitalea sp.]|nr:acyltransferase family protein [Flavitalea sp.]
MDSVEHSPLTAHNSQANRQSYLDWLRMLAILGVLVFHSAMPFAAEEGWHIKNKDTSYLFTEFNFWLSRFRMPLLFFISGGVSYFILMKKNAGQFIKVRFHRLMIPLLFGMLVIVPPQIYMERLTQGFTGNYFDFYPRIFEGQPYPEGNTSWHHLWFILYLFIYNLVAAPFFIWVMKNKERIWSGRLQLVARGKWAYLLILPSVIVYTALTLQFPQTNDLIHDWASLPYWFLFLVVGFVCIVFGGITESLQRNRRTSLLLAFLTIISINYVRWNGIEPWDTLANWKTDWRTYAFLALYPATAWFWIFALIGYGKKYINKKRKILDYVNEAVYPFYILHQTIIVILAYYVVQVSDSILSKYIFIVLVTFALSMLIYHLIIRPNNVLRYLFGMSPLKKLGEAKPLPKTTSHDVLMIPAETGA